ncbi:MAG: hypothetical protein ACOYXM_01630 [Actinomycetota bacterium]
MPTATAERRPSTVPAPRSVPQRWHSLDVLKGLALWAVLAHHFHDWTAGDVRGRFVGFDGFAVTDLAPPMFALALGAAAAVVGGQVESWLGLRRPTWHWAQIFLVGVLLDLAIDGKLAWRGVLPTLAVLGLSVTLATAAGLRHPAAWWAIAGACAVLAVPAAALAGEEPLGILLGGPFALPVYGVFAAAGAAVATHARGRSEGDLPLVRSAAVVLVVGLLAAAIGGDALAPHGLWPPDRYPGDLAFTLWGLVASLLVWAAARRFLGPQADLGRAVARAGQRTLVVFASHFVVAVALRAGGWSGELDTHRWGIVIWGAVFAACAATTMRLRRRSPA